VSRPATPHQSAAALLVAIGLDAVEGDDVVARAKEVLDTVVRHGSDYAGQVLYALAIAAFREVIDYGERPVDDWLVALVLRHPVAP
jgi:hypothetical protein